MTLDKDYNAVMQPYKILWNYISTLAQSEYCLV